MNNLLFTKYFIKAFRMSSPLYSIRWPAYYFSEVEFREFGAAKTRMEKHLYLLGFYNLK